MRKETDLGGVKAIAKILLMTAVNQMPYSPMLVQHPFTSTGLVALPTEKYEGFRPIDITLNEENLKRWQESVCEFIIGQTAASLYYIAYVACKNYGYVGLAEKAANADYNAPKMTGWTAGVCMFFAKRLNSVKRK